MPLGRQLALTNKAMQHWVDDLLAQHGSSLTTWIVLHHAAAAPPPGLSQKEIADSMHVGGPALVRHLDRLEAAGLVRRTRDAGDRRVTRITLTAAGKRHHAELQSVMDAHDQAMRATLTPTELRHLQRALDKLADYVRTTDVRPTDPETDAHERTRG